MHGERWALPTGMQPCRALGAELPEEAGGDAEKVTCILLLC